MVSGEPNETSRAIAAAIQWLEARQHADGYWVGQLETNCCMEAEWLLAFHVLEYEYPYAGQLVSHILAQQRDDGAWEVYFDAPAGDINTTVECYAALRTSGLPADDKRLLRARQWIADHGGLAQTRVFTRYWLALIGEWPWEKTPNLPPELIRFARWFPFNIYHFASWARATIVPLCVVSARRLTRPLPADRRLDELFPQGRGNMDYALPKRGGFFSWSRLFLAADRVLHVLQRRGVTPGRDNAIKLCLEWIIRHQDADGAWGGIQPPWIYSLLALHASGYPLTHPVMAHGLAALEGYWSCETEHGRLTQACESPVWDTFLGLLALLDSGVIYSESASMRRAVAWAVARQVRVPGDWSVTSPGVEPGGWAFERANDHYPDVDDTAVALIVLARLRAQGAPVPGLDEAIARAVAWVEAMQCANGGWGAFDRDNTRQLLTKIPFCDFGETLDPPSVDVTAHVLEALGELGRDASDPVVARALAYVRNEQEASGSWFGRWGVNHIYGTGAVLPALRAIGEDMRAPYVLRATRWLVTCQQADGGWGESCASYMDESLIGRGPVTASQTAWALMALHATGNEAFAPAIQRGVDWLVARQTQGGWDEPHYTGTGFPGYGSGLRTDVSQPAAALELGQDKELQRGFMIKYGLYRHYFPLMALGRIYR
ncbi:MAG: squalene--hopene cyclase [Gammaproteobacteria bacterium]|nr:squalene--hopene cyclase [Gammaproteobacteria bacterium]